MNLVLTVMGITAPVFGLAAIGYAWVRLGFEFRLQFVTRLAMTLAVPCLIFVSLMQTEIDPAALADISMASFLGYAIVSVIFFAIVRLARFNQQTYLAPLVFGNTGNLGLPLALFAYGDVGLGYAVVVFAVMAVFSFTIGVWLVAGGGSPWRVLKEPMVGATLLGGLFLWQGWETPVPLTNMLSLIGQMAIPLMLITLGVALALLQIKALRPAIVLSLIKAAVCVAAGVFVSIWFDLPPIAAGVLILQISTPVAVTSYMLAEKYGADAQSVAGLVVVSTLLSLVTLPLILAFVI